MNYTLMHKDIPVADLTLDEATGSIQRIDALLHREHLPVGVKAPSQFEQACETCGLAGGFAYSRNEENPSFLELC